MEMVLTAKNQIRLRAWLACAELNDEKEAVAEFRREYAQNHRTDEESNTSTGSTEQLAATDDTIKSPENDDYP